MTAIQIKWNPEDSVGVKSIDEQHKQLIVLINDLFEAIMKNEGFEIVKRILEELARYVGDHFTHEEKLLEAHNFDSQLLREHIDEHRKLTTELYEFMVKFKLEEKSVDLGLYQFLRDWMVDHLQDTDRKYADFLQMKGAQ